MCVKVRESMRHEGCPLLDMLLIYVHIPLGPDRTLSETWDSHKVRWSLQVSDKSVDFV